ncbi:MAG: PIN domain-containing protein [Treponema sp.]|nr:PIN domain-containing protein [Treponema sp.]
MKALVDTNVVLDVILQRSPFYQNSFAIFQLVDQGHISACLSATTMTTIFYVLRKARNNADETYRMMDELTDLFSVALVSEKTIADALALRWNDFEDAVQYIAARENSADYIVTRDTQDFSSGHIPAVTPEQFMRIIADIEQ